MYVFIFISLKFSYSVLTLKHSLTNFQVCSLRLAGDDQEFADFYASQQPSTSGSGRPQCKTNNQSGFMIIASIKYSRFTDVHSHWLIDWCV